MLTEPRLAAFCRVGSTVAAVLAMLTAVPVVLAVFGPWLGAGRDEEFVIYRWVGWDRSHTLAAGLAWMVPAAIVAITLWLLRMTAGRVAAGATSWRSAAANAGLSILSTMVGFVALEAAVRLADGVSLTSTENFVARRVSLLQHHTANNYDPLLGWVLRPHQTSGSNEDDSFTIGEHGVRMNQNRILPVPHDAILAVGDSFTAGSEVGDRHSWPAHLERLTGMPVVNAAAGAWGPDQMVLRAESLIDSLHPRVVIVSLLADEIRRAGLSIFGGGNKPYFLIRDGQLKHMNYPVPVFSNSIQDVGVLRSVLGRLYLYDWALIRIGVPRLLTNSAERRADTDPVQVSCLLLRRLRQRTQDARIRLLLVLQYGGGHIARRDAPHRFPREVRACAEQAGIATLDLWESLRAVWQQGEKALQELYVMHDDRRVYGHMSSAGNALVAREIAARLGRQ